MGRKNSLFFSVFYHKRPRAAGEKAGIVLNFILFYFKQYLVRGAQFSGAGLNGALMKTKKNNTQDSTIKDKKWYNLVKKSKGGSIRLGSKVPF